MRATRTTAAVPLLLTLLTWVSFSALDLGAERYDRALGTLDRFTMTENVLQRDILSARIGILRNYDPLVAETRALDAMIPQLRETATVDAKGAATIDRLAAAVATQENLVEQFKSKNALLQNSLAYFGLYSSQLGAADRTGSIGRAVSGLAAAMLQLTLDASSETVEEEVDGRLKELAMQVPPQSDAASVQALLAHGRLLGKLIPSIDHVLEALRAVPQRREGDALRDMVQAHIAASRTTGREYRLVLYITSVLLVAVLVHLGLRLRTNTLALQRRAAMEHVIAGISTRLINVQPSALGAHIKDALAELAGQVGADRAYFMTSANPVLRYAWSREGIGYPSGWLDQVPDIASQFHPDTEGIIHIPSIDRLPQGHQKDTFSDAGLHGWVCVPTPAKPTRPPLLGFDSLQAGFTSRSDEFGLLRMALDAVSNAVGRSLLEQEAARLEQRLGRARRMETVGALASGIAHNFNNIVAAILGYAEIARGQLPPDSPPAQNLAEIHNAGERARELIDQILAFGRSRDTRRASLDLRDLVTEATSLLRVSLPADTELAVSHATGAAAIMGERGQLQQVILNLCNNASQAMDGVGCVRLETELHEVVHSRHLSHGELRPGRYACIAVSDTGRGMDEAVLNRIFEPFFTTRVTGNGLGLATVQEVVREHGGVMSVRSVRHAGSRFEAWLPCTFVDIRKPDTESAGFLLGHGETVLLVDEGLEQLHRDEEILAALGYEPVGFARAGDALNACRNAPGRFDMAVVGHPGSSTATLELASALHAIRPDLPIVLAAACIDEMDADALVQAGVSDVVHWPIVATEMATALANEPAIARFEGRSRAEEPRRHSLGA